MSDERPVGRLPLLTRYAAAVQSVDVWQPSNCQLPTKFLLNVLHVQNIHSHAYMDVNFPLWWKVSEWWVESNVRPDKSRSFRGWFLRGIEPNQQRQKHLWTQTGPMFSLGHSQSPHTRTLTCKQQPYVAIVCRFNGLHPYNPCKCTDYWHRISDYYKNCRLIH